MPFCPICRREYAADVELCNACEIELMQDLPPEIPPDYSDAEWVELCTFPGALYANMAIELLHREQIPCYSMSHYAGAALGPHNGAELIGTSVTIYVLEPDFDHAEAVIEPMTDEMPTQMEDEEEELY